VHAPLRGTRGHHTGDRVRAFAPGHDHRLERGHLADDAVEGGQQGLGDEQHLRARVAQHELEVLRGEQRVGGHRHDAGQDAAEEHHRPLGRVQHRQQHARLGLDAAGAQGVGKAVRLLGELAVGEGGAGRASMNATLPARPALRSSRSCAAL
jgi:hypothetical protein